MENDRKKAKLLNVLLAARRRETAGRVLSESHLDFKRIKACAHNSSKLDPQELTHLKRCEHCQTMLRGARKTEHPPALSLLEFKLTPNTLDDEHTDAVRIHLGANCKECESCFNPLLLELLRPAVEVGRSLKDVFKLGLIAKGRTPSLAVVNAPIGEKPRRRFYLPFQNDIYDGIIEELSTNQLSVFVSTKKAGIKKVQVDIVGESKVLSFPIVLTKREDEYAGTEYRDDFKKLIEGLGDIKVLVRAIEA